MASLKSLHPLSLNVGVEIECLLRFDNIGKDFDMDVPAKLDKNKNDLEQLIKKIRGHLKGSARIEAKDDETKNVWRAVEDGTIEKRPRGLRRTYKNDPGDRQQHDNTCAVEIVSPILQDAYLPQPGMWESRVKGIFYALHEVGITTSDTCGTHIHLSPGPSNPPGEWGIDDLKKICCCILYFERAFEVLYPEAKKDQHCKGKSWVEQYGVMARSSRRAAFAKPNWANNLYLEKGPGSYPKCVKLILGSKNVADLIELMNPQHNSRKMYEMERGARRADGHSGDKLYWKHDYDRYFAWNFANLTPGLKEKRTIEYRRPPGVKEAEKCVNWIKLAITFVRAAMQVEIDNLEYPLVDTQGSQDGADPSNITVGSLRRFLQTGLPQGYSLDVYMPRFFGGKEGGLDVVAVEMDPCGCPQCRYYTHPMSTAS